MKNLFAGALLVFLIAYGFDTGQCFQTRRPATKKTAKTAKRELSPENKRSNESAAKPVRSTEAEVSSFIDDFDAFTAELIGKVKRARNPTRGLNLAQIYMNARKAKMKARFAAIRCIPQAQVSEETNSKMEEHFYNNGFKVGQLQYKYGSTPAIKAKIQRLTEDYLDIFKHERPCAEEAPTTLPRNQTISKFLKSDTR